MIRCYGGDQNLICFPELEEWRPKDSGPVLELLVRNLIMLSLFWICISQEPEIQLKDANTGRSGEALGDLSIQVSASLEEGAYWFHVRVLVQASFQVHRLSPRSMHYREDPCLFKKTHGVLSSTASLQSTNSVLSNSSPITDKIHIILDLEFNFDNSHTLYEKIISYTQITLAISTKQSLQSKFSSSLSKSNFQI